jgi:hypothetical protein
VTHSTINTLENGSMKVNMAMKYSGSIDFSEPPLLEAIFLSNKAEMK